MMKQLLVRMAALVMAVALALGACRKPDVTDGPGASCGLTDDGGAFDVSGRADGLYAVEGDRLAPAALAGLARVSKTGAGVDPASGKRWIAMHLAEAEGRALRDFTADPTNTKLAVVANGELASVHKVRQAITSADFQISCCNPRACDRWSTLLDRAR